MALTCRCVKEYFSTVWRILKLTIRAQYFLEITAAKWNRKNWYVSNWGRDWTFSDLPGRLTKNSENFKTWTNGTNFLGKFPEKPEIVEFCDKRTNQPKIPKILGGKSNET